MIVERLLKVALLGSAWILYLLLFLSVVSVTAALERWLFFRRHADDVRQLKRKIEDALAKGDLTEAEWLLQGSPSIEARVVRAGLRWAAGGADAVNDAIESELSSTRADLERGTALLGTLGNNAPFVGLLGTVIGVIEAFHQLGAAGQNQGAMGNVMAGIAEALVATGVGLFVAIPAVVFYNLVQTRIGEIEVGVQAIGKLVTAHVRAVSHGSRPAARAIEEAPPTVTSPEAPPSPRTRDESGLAKVVARHSEPAAVASAEPVEG